jgi:hypothetical protein
MGLSRSLPIIFGTRENFRTKNVQFEVANYETAYTAFLGWPTLTKFMAIPHYTYLVLKIPGPCGVISIRGGIKRAYNYDKESCGKADRPSVATELQELKEPLVESPLDPIMIDSKVPQNVHPARGRSQQADTIV